MLFYKFTARWLDEVKLEGWNEERAYHEDIHSATDEYNRKHQGAVCFVAAIKGRVKSVVGAVALPEDKDAANIPEHFLKSVGLECSEVKAAEITFEEFEDLLEIGDRGDFLEDRDRPYSQFSSNHRGDPDGFTVAERILPEKAARSALEQRGKAWLWSESVSQELERIYTPPKNSKVRAHPVHYFLQDTPGGKGLRVADILAQALRASGRVRSRRVITVTYEPDRYRNLDQRELSILCDRARYCTVVLDLTPAPSAGGDIALPGEKDIRRIANVIRAYKRDVQFIIRVTQKHEKVRSDLFDHLPGMTFVEMKEDVIFGADAKAHLRKLARENHVKVNKALYSGMTDDERGYKGGELGKMFDRWFSAELKEQVFPQYAGQTAVLEKTVKAKPKGSAYDELRDMIGLAEAKAVMDKALAFYKARKLYRDKGLSDSAPAMHMVFTGAPGTAKTSVARLFARIMKENGITKKDQLVEVGRGDLVGQYVGWTAPTVQEKFKKASGGVLFIDEAYSLVDDKAGLYGDEAINTIVQEMENHRGDVIVIFAGYADKMEEFLGRNPGLRSRIAFHVPFADYSESELMEIAQLMTKKSGFRLAEDVESVLLPLFTRAKQDPEYGNGRFVRNLLEQARMNQAMRIVQGDVEHMGTEEIRTLTAEDFQNLSLKVSREKRVRKIGFCA